MRRNTNGLLKFCRWMRDRLTQCIFFDSNKPVGKYPFIMSDMWNIIYTVENQELRSFMAVGQKTSK
jgi:hypothetical protein